MMDQDEGIILEFNVWIGGSKDIIAMFGVIA